MRTTNYKICQHHTTRRLHKDLNICGMVKNHFIALSRRYYRRFKKPISYARMCRHLTKLKKLPKYEYWKEPYSWSVMNVLRRLSQSYRNMKIGQGRPRFRKVKKYRSFTLDGQYIRIKETKNPSFRRIKLNGRWYKFKYSRPIIGPIKQVHVQRDPLGDIYISVVEDYSELCPEPKTGKAAGFDFGLKTFLTVSDGTKIESPLFYNQFHNQIANANRTLSRKKKGSNNWYRAKKTLNRLYKKLTNSRSDHHWKLAIELLRTFDWCFFEDLNLQEMKKLFGKKVSDLSFGMFLQKAKHQSNKRLKEVYRISRWSPTTKCCSVCGHKNTDLTLNDRTWDCPSCSTHLDRDVNAAINVLKEGAASFELGAVSLALPASYSVKVKKPLKTTTNS